MYRKRYSADGVSMTNSYVDTKLTSNNTTILSMNAWLKAGGVWYSAYDLIGSNTYVRCTLSTAGVRIQAGSTTVTAYGIEIIYVKA